MEPIFNTKRFRDTKDPCPVFDGELWHIYGSGGSSESEVWRILHATSGTPEGPWQEEEPVALKGLRGEHVAAPGVFYDHAAGVFHMFVQTEFMNLGGTIEHLVSADGAVFERTRTCLESLPGTEEAGIYDPHPAEIGDEKYLSYSGCKVAGKPDIFLARSSSGTWDGPWERLGRILGHEEVPHHNQLDHADYEWGLEGSQLIDLGFNQVLLNAVCFLPEGSRGTRQRIFFALSSNGVKGPYRSLGPVIDPARHPAWGAGENGHAAAVREGEELRLFYQARKGEGEPWRYGCRNFPIAAILRNTNVSQIV